MTHIQQGTILVRSGFRGFVLDEHLILQSLFRFSNGFVDCKFQTGLYHLKLKKNTYLFLIFHLLQQRDVTYLSSHFYLNHLMYQSSSVHFLYQSPTHSFRYSFPSYSFTDHSPSHSHSPYLVLLILHRISASLSLLFFNQSSHWKLGVSLDKILIRNIYLQDLRERGSSVAPPHHHHHHHHFLEQ